MSAVALLKEPCGKDDDAIRECMSGNICRCGAYNNIVAAVRSVRGGALGSLNKKLQEEVQRVRLSIYES
jgi:xanthine dehydrogenase iron-sulfur cluster and FAD-binding subunit A